MITLKLKASSSHKLVKLERELSVKDIEEVPKSITPGEWVFIVDEAQRKKYLSYMNPHSESFFNIKIIKSYPIEWKAPTGADELAIEVIQELILEAIRKRTIFNNYALGARLVYGVADCLPGLLVDMYVGIILIQINTAGLDKFRIQIKKIFEEKFPDKKTLLFDNTEYRKLEILPTYENEKLEYDLEVYESSLKYLIKKERIQKIGYYYDHRENRLKLLNKIKELNIAKNNGLDLFSYVGSWGLHLLAAGVEFVDFVDQGDMNDSIETNLKLNNFSGSGKFIRKDVFKFLDESLLLEKRYDVIVSDPPAFTKSEKNKITAIQGYEKLHFKALKLLNDNGLFVAASCTHYVDYFELDKTVQDAAIRNNQKVQLLDIGIQGHDHLMTGLKDKSFYIKYLLYFIERGQK